MPSSPARATAGATSSQKPSTAAAQRRLDPLPLHTYTVAAPTDEAKSSVSTVRAWSSSHHPVARSAPTGR